MACLRNRNSYKKKKEEGNELEKEEKRRELKHMFVFGDS